MNQTIACAIDRRCPSKRDKSLLTAQNVNAELQEQHGHGVIAISFASTCLQHTLSVPIYTLVMASVRNHSCFGP